MGKVTPIKRKASGNMSKTVAVEKITEKKSPLDAFIKPDAFFSAPGRKNHLIENYMPGRGTITTIIAGPGVGKTTLVADLAFSFALKMLKGKSRTFLKQRITQAPAPVLFIAREGHRQLKLLGAAWQSVTKTEFADSEQYELIAVLDEQLRPKLDIKSDHAELCMLLDAFVEAYGNPGLIILDTARKLLSDDENNSKAVSEFMQHAQEIAIKYNTAIVCLHHTPKSGTLTARGSGAWLADTDCEWTLSRSGKTITIDVTKLKGFELPPPLFFTIESYTTEFEDLDNPGEMLTAANIKQCDAPKGSKSKNKSAENDAIAEGLMNSLENKHLKRQESRLATMVAAWEASGSEMDNGGTPGPYIARAALAEYLTNTLGYTENTVKQALKPSGDTDIKTCIIGPLLTDGLITKHAHGWIINSSTPVVTEAPATPSNTTANPAKIRKKLRG